MICFRCRAREAHELALGLCAECDDENNAFEHVTGTVPSAAELRARERWEALDPSDSISTARSAGAPAATIDAMAM